MKKTLILALLAAASILPALPAKANADLLEAYRQAFVSKDAAACVGLFGEGAKFMDLGNDFSERLDWFCQAVIDGNGQYTFTDVATAGPTTTFNFAFVAGGYNVAGKGSLTEKDGKIGELIIER